ncbi:MAG: D-alanine--D-alanine ligase [Candidatus Omnitrophica bacterium]|nr:D-alanine--D-alanine ligase [Candidatus Omnitrophota bacterium]
MRIGLTYDLQTDPTDPRQAEFDPPQTLAVISAALQALGHEPVLIGDAQQLLQWLRTGCPVDLVFNIAEGAGGRCREAWVPVLLEARRIPYVGSGPAALVLGLDKLACKRLALASGLRTPPWVAAATPDELPAALPFPFPAIVKPRYEGSGIGIDPGAVVESLDDLRRRAHWLWARWPEPLLIEQFIPDGELTVCLIGNDPPEAFAPIQRPIDRGSRLSCHVSTTARWDTPLELTDAMDQQAHHLASVMFEAIGCRDFARTDFRVDRAGDLWFLEINPLPSLDPEGSFALLAECSGVGYPQIIGRIVDAAVTRLGRGVVPAPFMTNRS